jgi:hypothetical protein
MALEQSRAIERLRKRFAYNVIDKNCAYDFQPYSLLLFYSISRWAGRKTLPPGSAACGDSISTEQLLQCSIRSHIPTGCEYQNQLNTSNDDSIATFDLKRLNWGGSLQSRKLQIHRT